MGGVTAASENRQDAGNAEVQYYRYSEEVSDRHSRKIDRFPRKYTLILFRNREWRQFLGAIPLVIYGGADDGGLVVDSFGVFQDLWCAKRVLRSLILFGSIRESGRPAEHGSHARTALERAPNFSQEHPLRRYCSRCNSE